MGGFGEQFRNLALKVGLDLANALRLAAECLRAVQQRVVIELNERLQRHIQPLAVIQRGMVVIGNPPWPRIYVESLIEFAGLRGAAELGEFIAAAQGPIAAAG